MSTKCPMCGHAVRIVGSDEGTNHYEPVETVERSASLLKFAAVVADFSNDPSLVRDAEAILRAEGTAHE